MRIVMYNALELFSVCWVYVLLCYLPFGDQLKIKRGTLAGLAIAVLLVSALAYGGVSYLESQQLIPAWLNQTNSSVLIFLTWFALFPLTVRASWGKLSFVYCTVFFYGYFFQGISLHLELAFFPEEFLRYDSPVTILIMAPVYAAFAPPVVYLMRKQLAPLVRMEQGKAFWRYLWVLPAGFVLLLGFTTEMVGLDTESHTAFFINYLMFYLVAFLSYHSAMRMLYETVRNERLEQEARVTQQLLSGEESRYQELARTIEATRAARHDLRHHMLVLGRYAQLGQCAEIERYISELIQAQPVPAASVCENPAVDNLMSFYLSWAREQSFPLRVSLNCLSASLPIQPVDLCILIGNCMENAIEASLFLPSERRDVRVSARRGSGSLYLLFENRYDGTLLKQGDRYLSRKRSGKEPGLGIDSVRAVVHQYSGLMDIEATGELFTVSIMLEERKRAAQLRP